MKSETGLVFKAGNTFLGETIVTVVNRNVRVVNPEGRVLFDVSIGDDGHSLIITAVDTVIEAGKLYGTSLVIHPHCANSVSLSQASVDWP